ncbi:MAG: sodium:solute symporter [Candidatus Latescibacteria bacterium]|nr:sodium:solute symporter [Candidatus Latescibacterota bacterium]
MLSGIDSGVIILYFIMVTAVGLYVSKKASGSINDYFLGGRHIPWYILGISGMATFIDMSGTMLQVSFFYILGVKGYWVAWRGAICLFLAFFMIFMAKWLNRSEVMTNAEWIEFRFGKGKQAKIARILSAISVLMMAIPIVSYFFVGSGKFLSIYLPFPPEISALVFFLIVMVYTVAAGFYGVVYTDLFQSMLILGIIFFITVKAMMVGTPEYFSKFTTPEWRTILPSSWKIDMPSGYENMRFLGMLIIFWIISNVFQGFAVPLDGWTSQRYYAAKDERESSLVAFQWITLFSFRFLLMMGLGVLALGIAGKITEPEMALPAVIEYYVPVGIKGFLLAALIAAAMSSVDSIINSSAAYFVKDIYHAFINPEADNKHLLKVSYITTLVIFIAGIAIGWVLPNINSIWAWIIMGLITGMMPPNILKWFWWRFNGLGYAFGMGFGLAGATVAGVLFPNAAEYTTFSFVILVSTIGTVIGTFMGEPTDRKVLVAFYKKTRPFGFWGPVRQQCDPEFVTDIKKENRRDLLLLAPACLWQVLLFWIMTAIVVRKWISFGVSTLTVVVLSWILYKYWYKNLRRV